MYALWAESRAVQMDKGILYDQMLGNVMKIQDCYKMQDNADKIYSGIFSQWKSVHHRALYT